jgi:hypothetical protein
MVSPKPKRQYHLWVRNLADEDKEGCPSDEGEWLLEVS